MATRKLYIKLNPKPFYFPVHDAELRKWAKEYEVEVPGGPLEGDDLHSVVEAHLAENFYDILQDALEPDNCPFTIEEK